MRYSYFTATTAATYGNTKEYEIVMPWMTSVYSKDSFGIVFPLLVVNQNARCVLVKVRTRQFVASAIF